MREEFVIGATYNSNAIEGNTLTLRETALILREGVTIGEKPLKDHLEAIGHRDAFEYVLSLVNSGVPLTERVVKDIHSLVLMNDRRNKGIYRSIPVTIAGSAGEPPQPYMVPEMMERLIVDYEKIKNDKHIVEAAAELHLRFEEIHPFIDGNGRTGRLLINFELMGTGLLPVDIKYIDRRKYYDCFDAYAASRRPDALAELIAGYEAEALERYISIITNRP